MLQDDLRVSTAMDIYEDRAQLGAVGLRFRRRHDVQVQTVFGASQ